MYDVITVGSATVDVFANTKYSELIKIRTTKKEIDLLAYPAGTKILIKELRFTTGGGGTNTAVALSRSGHKVGFLGKLGCDENADFILKKLKEEKVDFLGVCGKEIGGYSVILDSIEHDRTILAYKGANDNLRFKEINLKKLNTKWFYFSAMLNESFKTLEKLAEFAEKNDIKICFNASTYLAKKGRLFLKNILSRTDILVLNKEEAGYMSGKEIIMDMFKSLRGVGVKTIVITDGKKESYCYDGSYVYSFKPHKEIKIIETTGAGDAFAAGFLSGIIKKKGIKFALQLANTNSESVIQYHGAKEKLLTYKGALAVMKRVPVRVKRKKKI